MLQYTRNLKERSVDMRIAGIVRDSVVDGPGLRDVIFFQGCHHHCKGCHNPQTWNYEGGEEWFYWDVVKELSDSSNDITISGGEPLDQIFELYELLNTLHRTTKKRIWLYTGYTVDMSMTIFRKLAQYVDVIVDGEFIEELKNPDLLFRGSSNQRLVDMKKSLKEDKVVEWKDERED